ncbi:uncharacterized protein JN550_003004 [Neoarthrinium moseri]|uniref:uncharacterized protein n=1 Tax=Neoarthrinium moseri TaxID=1658444 RepID=UPI001FDD1C5B|nr:uncharacterized protein JN550_003004 [Neoarthrinium moseri]KAI1873735.1 hypothetical protein JN550_003004 [Neoarthrinium moseri]
MANSSKGVSLQVKIYLKPEDLPKFFEHFKPAYDQIIAEPECTFFEMYQSQEEPGTLFWVENWSVSKEWLIQNQFPKEYYKPYFAATDPLHIKSREIQFLDLVSGYSTAKP